MIVKIDRTGKKESIFACDRCGKELDMSKDLRFRISVAKARGKDITGYKKWDLCKHCYNSLNRGIENYKEKSEEK